MKQPRITTRLALLPAAGASIVAVGLIALFIEPGILAVEGLSGKDLAEELGRIRTASLAALALLFAAIGAFYTHRNFVLNQAGQLTERFTRSIDQLGEREKPEVRIGAIYGLERIARDSAADHPQVVEVLTAYVRARTE